MKISSYKYLFLLSLLSGCVEEFPVQDELVSSNFQVEGILIVEGIITDEQKQQEIILSRGSNFLNDSVVNFERNAQVLVTDSNGQQFEFNEVEDGHYRSEQSFAALPGLGYTLFIATTDGATYQSETAQMSGTSIIEDIYAERIISDNEVEGMAIFVDSSNPNTDSGDYLYTFEETYKIIAPNWTAFEFEIIREEGILITNDEGVEVDFLPKDVRVVPRQQEERVCFNTESSREIILSNGTAINSNRINRNLIRFINRNDAIISHRYSIQVRQLLLGADGADFYRTLLSFSQNESLFSEIQLGLIEGNITNTSNSENPVIGLFEVGSVTERRLFFNYGDFFPNEPLPPYFGTTNCDRLTTPILDNLDRDGPIPPFVTCGRFLIDLIKSEEVEFVDENGTPGECEGPYFVTPRPCGDCTALGSNVVPEFWIEE